MSTASLSMVEDAGFTRRRAKLAAATAQACLLGRLSMEAAARMESDATPARNAARRRREDEVFEYGLSAIIAGLRASLEEGA